MTFRHNRFIESPIISNPARSSRPGRFPQSVGRAQSARRELLRTPTVSISISISISISTPTVSIQLLDGFTALDDRAVVGVLEGRPATFLERQHGARAGRRWYPRRRMRLSAVIGTIGS